MHLYFSRAANAAAYQPAQPGYAVTPAATAATYSPQRPATGYETYQAAATAAAPAAYAGALLSQRYYYSLLLC